MNSQLLLAPLGLLRIIDAERIHWDEENRKGYIQVRSGSQRRRTAPGNQNVSFRLI